MDLSFFSSGINKGNNSLYFYPPNGPKVPVVFHPPYASDEYSKDDDDLLPQRERAGEALLNKTKFNLLNPFSDETKFYDTVSTDEQLKELVYEKFKDMKDKKRILKNIPDRLKPIVEKILKEKGISTPEVYNDLLDYYAKSGILQENDARDVKRLLESNIIRNQEYAQVERLRFMREVESIKQNLRSNFSGLVSPSDFERVFNRAVISSNLFTDPTQSTNRMLREAENAILRVLQEQEQEIPSTPPQYPDEDEEEADNLRESTYTGNLSSARNTYSSADDYGEIQGYVGRPIRNANSWINQVDLLDNLVETPLQSQVSSLRMQEVRRQQLGFLERSLLNESLERRLPIAQGVRLIESPIFEATQEIIQRPPQRTQRVTSAAEVALPRAGRRIPEFIENDIDRYRVLVAKGRRTTRQERTERDSLLEDINRELRIANIGQAMDERGQLRKTFRLLE